VDIEISLSMCLKSLSTCKLNSFVDLHNFAPIYLADVGNFRTLDQIGLL
jgi:hypothetical protein